MDFEGIGRPSWPKRLTSKTRIEDNTSFREVLQLRISQTNPASSATGPDVKAAFLEQGERVLDLLDDFAQALGDPQKTLRELEPLVLKMEGEAKPLELAPDSEGGSDQSLSRLMSDVSLLANVTLVKFRRGDYL
jgi:hypothetical protein